MRHAQTLGIRNVGTYGRSMAYRAVGGGTWIRYSTEPWLFPTSETRGASWVSSTWMRKKCCLLTCRDGSAVGLQSLDSKLTACCQPLASKSKGSTRFCHSLIQTQPWRSPAVSACVRSGGSKVHYGDPPLDIISVVNFSPWQLVVLGGSGVSATPDTRTFRYASTTSTSAMRLQMSWHSWRAFSSIGCGQVG